DPGALVAHALEAVGNAELLRAPRGGGGCAAGDPADGDARRGGLAQAVAVLGVEDLELATRAVEVNAAVRQDTVDIEEEGPDAAALHRPAERRSCMWRAPARRPPSSTMKSDVIFWDRMISSAAEANSSAAMVLGPTRQHAPAVFCSSLASRSSIRR